MRFRVPLTVNFQLLERGTQNLAFQNLEPRNRTWNPELEPEPGTSTWNLVGSTFPTVR